MRKRGKKRRRRKYQLRDSFFSSSSSFFYHSRRGFFFSRSTGRKTGKKISKNDRGGMFGEHWNQMIKTVKQLIIVSSKSQHLHIKGRKKGDKHSERRKKKECLGSVKDRHIKERKKKKHIMTRTSWNRGIVYLLMQERKRARQHKNHLGSVNVFLLLLFSRD